MMMSQPTIHYIYLDTVFLNYSGSITLVTNENMCRKYIEFKQNKFFSVQLV